MWSDPITESNCFKIVFRSIFHMVVIVLAIDIFTNRRNTQDRTKSACWLSNEAKIKVQSTWYLKSFTKRNPFLRMLFKNILKPLIFLLQWILWYLILFFRFNIVLNIFFDFVFFIWIGNLWMGISSDTMNNTYAIFFNINLWVDDWNLDR